MISTTTVTRPRAPDWSSDGHVSGLWLPIGQDPPITQACHGPAKCWQDVAAFLQLQKQLEPQTSGIW